MRPGFEGQAGELAARRACPASGAALSEEALRREGSEYAAELLQRVRTGDADADALASLIVFMGRGAMLAGLCDELHRAIREGAAS